MKLIGIDYGTKRVGIAVSDDAGRLAFPRLTLSNDRSLVEHVVSFIAEEGVQTIVIGESKDLAGGDNPVMQDARAFADRLKKETQLPVHFEPEWYTSVEARRLKEGAEAVDAEAAAIILSRYLAKQNVYDDLD